jgi:uncharacterized protein
MSDPPRCVYCRARPAVAAWRPFCSERCKTADLGRWLTGGYRVAGPSADPSPEDLADDEDLPGGQDRD